MTNIATTEKEMFHEIMEEVRYIRKRLDTHITDERDGISSVKADISKIREEMAGHKTKLGVISSGIAIVVAAAMSWTVSVFGK